MYPATNLTDSIARAAELRAEGQSWEQVARALDLPESTVRGWAREHPAVWADCLETARVEMREHSFCAALAALRSLLQCDDLKVKRDAARELLRQTAPRNPVSDRPRRPAEISFPTGDSPTEDELPLVLDGLNPGKNESPHSPAGPEPPGAATELPAKRPFNAKAWGLPPPDAGVPRGKTRR